MTTPAPSRVPLAVPPTVPPIPVGPAAPEGSGVPPAGSGAGGPGCAVFDLTCRASAAADDIFARVVGTIAAGSADLIVATSTWWAGTDSVDPRAAAVLTAQHATAPLTVALLVGGILVAAIKMILSRKAEPLLAVGAGLTRFVLVSALGLTVLAGALQAGDALSRQLLGDAAGQFAAFMRAELTAPGESLFVTLLVAIVAAVLSLVQWLLMALRQAGLLVLAAMLPLAASGPRGWLYRLAGWLAAMVAYKPAAAFIYYLGFTYLSAPAQGRGTVGTQVTGVMVLLLAVLAMPVLLRFFAWTGTAVAGAGGGSAFVGAAGAAALAYGGARSPAISQAAAVDATGPGSTNPAGAAATGSTTGPAAAGAGSAATGAAGAAAGVAGPAGAAVAAGAAATRAAGAGMTGGAPDTPDTGAGGEGER